MIRRYGWVVCLAVAMIFVAASCSGATTSTSVGGASVTMGLEVNDNLTIRSSKTSFAVDEVFNVSFDNNSSFGANQVTMRVEDSETREIVGEVDYNVDPEWTIMATDGSLTDPGKYKISFIIDGRVRASQQVIIK